MHRMDHTFRRVAKKAHGGLVWVGMPGITKTNLGLNTTLMATRNPVNSPVEVGSLSHWFYCFFLHLWWLFGSINSMFTLNVSVTIYSTPKKEGKHKGCKKYILTMDVKNWRFVFWRLADHPKIFGKSSWVEIRCLPRFLADGSTGPDA